MKIDEVIQYLAAVEIKNDIFIVLIVEDTNKNTIFGNPKFYRRKFYRRKI